MSQLPDREMAKAEVIRAIIEAYPDRWEDLVRVLDESVANVTISRDEVEYSHASSMGPLSPGWPEWVRIGTYFFRRETKKENLPGLWRGVSRAKKWLGLE